MRERTAWGRRRDWLRLDEDCDLTFPGKSRFDERRTAMSGAADPMASARASADQIRMLLAEVEAGRLTAPPGFVRTLVGALAALEALLRASK